MSYSPFDRNPSGIVFFTNGGTEPVFDSDSNFILATGSPGYIKAPNLRVADNGNIGSVSDPDAIAIASNGNVTFSQDVSIAGDLIVNGTLTSVNSTEVTIEDPILTLGGSGIPTVDDNKDRGIAFKYFSGSAKTGFFGFDDSSGKFTFIPDATITNEVVSGSTGTIVAALEGNATTATNLQTARNFSVTGNMTASAVSFNGGANVVLTGVLHPTAISDRTAITSVDATNDFLLIWDATDSQLKKINRTNFVSGLGAMSSFTISDGTNTDTISDGNTLLFRNGAAINFTVSATDSVSGTLNASVAGNGLSMTNQVLNINVASGIQIANDTVRATASSGIVVDSNGIRVNLNSYATQSASLAAISNTPNRSYVIQPNASDQLVVNVPWDNTTYEAGVGLAKDPLTGTSFTFRAVAGSGTIVDSNGIHVNAGTGLLNTAGGLQIGIGNGITGAADAISVTDGSGIFVNAGGVHVNLISYAAQAEGANTASSTSGRTYPIQVDGSDKLVVNVPWSDTNTTYTAGTGLSLNGTTFNLASTAAGSGLAIDANGLHIDLNEYSSVAIASGDRLFTLDWNNDTEQLTTISNLGAYLAGTNITAGGDGKLTVTNATVEGVVFTDANFVDSTIIDFTVTAGESVTATVKNDSIGNTQLRNSAAYSVIGRSGSTSGDPADIAAASDHQVLRRSGTTLGFGAINLASTNAVTGDLPYSNLAQGSALSVLGVTGNATADVASITAGTDGFVLRRSGTTLGFGTVATEGITDGAVTEAKRFRDVVVLTDGPAQNVAIGDIILCNALSGPIGISALPAHSEGKIIRIKKIDASSNTVTISPNLDGGQKILYSQYESLTIVSYNNAWYII